MLLTAVLYTAWVLCQPTQATAQWSIADGLGNIHNTNGNNVGVGTSAPSNKLTVAQDGTLSDSSSGQFHIVGATNPLNRLALGFDTSGTFGWVQAATSGTAYRNLSLQPFGGNVGIGTTNPGSPLSISGNVNTGTNLLIESTDTGGRPWVIKSTGSASTGGPGNLAFRDVIAGVIDMIILGGSGNVGVGTTSPSQNA